MMILQLRHDQRRTGARCDCSEQNRQQVSQCKGINNERQVDTEKNQQKTQQSGKCGETQSHVLVYC